MERMPVNSFIPILLPSWPVIVVTGYGQGEEKSGNKLPSPIFRYITSMGEHLSKRAGAL
jgi:hypothetical protein